MTSDLAMLLLTAVSIGALHTLLGPDHYIPFVAMAKAGRWSVPKTAVLTVVCGVGHVAGSIILGFIGVAFGVAVARLEWIESMRGNIAGWLLIAFGLVFTVWGLRKAFQRREHTHWHAHPDGSAHAHTHQHVAAHIHAHSHAGNLPATPWVLFMIFVFGPCEPLIPILMYPAARNHVFDAVAVSLAFGAATILTMLALVLASLAGLRFLPAARWERFSAALAGVSILFCGLAIQFLGV